MDHSANNLSQAILHTVAYSDIFDYPLTAREIHRYLIGVKASFDEVAEAVEEDVVVRRTGDYFTLPGREGIVGIRTQREMRSRELLQRAIQCGRLLGKLPYIRMVALTGSLAVMNVSKNEDFDYMLVTAPGRVWTARAFALLFNRFVRPFGLTICPNLIVSETALEWPLHDLYSARELYQMIPIAGMNVYRDVMGVNSWAQEILPNAFNANVANWANFANEQKINSRHSPFRVIRVEEIRNLLELPFRNRLGDKLESWEMTRKIARFSQQPGFGEETIFTTEVCQGNFHHHRKWTREVFQEKLDALTRQLETSKERIREFV